MTARSCVFRLAAPGLARPLGQRLFHVGHVINFNSQFKGRRPNNRDRNGYNNRNSRYNPKRQNNFSRRKFQDRDSDEIQFDEATLAKLIHVPKDTTAAEITLDQLLEANVLDKLIHKSIARMGFDGLTAVQQKTIKPIIEDEENDVIARAKTGTGKTFAFLIPIFQHLINSKLEYNAAVKAVIVAPTRDLALQIEAEVKKIHKNNYGLKKFECISLVGGTNFDASMRKMTQLRPNIVIATPGRLLDVLDKVGNRFFKSVDFKVLDEADRLLEIGFKEDLQDISKILNDLNVNSPEHIRTLMFSATLDEKVQKLSNSIMNKKSCLFIDTVDKNEPEAHEKIAQSLVTTERFADNIYAAIQHIKTQIEETPKYKAILFTPTVKFTKFISHILRREFGRNLPVLEFHGKIEQRRRTNLVREFKHDESGLLVCTDVGARGMDFPNVQEVLQIGVPSELSNYVHRIGRTARSGKEGKSTIFLCKGELPFIETLEDRKNIIIKDKKTYVANEKLVEEFATKIDEPYELSDTLFSLISYYRACAKEYGFHTRKLLPEITSAYGIFLNDPNIKIKVRRMQLEKLGLLNNPLAKEMFEIETSRNFGRGNENDDYEYGSNRSSYNRYNNNSRDEEYNGHSRNNSRTKRYNRFDN